MGFLKIEGGEKFDGKNVAAWWYREIRIFGCDEFAPKQEYPAA
jgi:hypothetical protein